MRLLLIRHGQTPHNITGALDTARPGALLTALGTAQAAALPAALAGEPIAAIHASPLTRTQLTAAPLAAARGLKVRVREGFEEVSAGDLELRDDDEAVAAYLDGIFAWADGDLDHHLPGGPDGHAFLARYDAAVRAVTGRRRDGETVVVVSHGAAIRTWTGLRAVNAGPDFVRGHRLTNTGAATLVGSPDAGWTLTDWHPEPLGGALLEDLAAHDVTGEADDETTPATC
jgi:probable phosphoglycerate mutase